MKARLLLTAFCVTALSFAAASPALGLANRVFVSARSGNNANSCDNILTPCQTFAGAVLQLNPAGEAIVLDSGGYGPVTITQALTIEAPPGVLAFIHPPSGDAITVNAGSTDTVILRGLVLNGGCGNGIIVNTVGALHVEGCVISGFASCGDPTHGNGIFFGSAGRFFVKDTVIRENILDGIAVHPTSGTAHVSVDHCRVQRNLTGVLVFSNTKLTIHDSDVSGNQDGFADLGGELNLENCVVANNTVNGILSEAGTIRVSNTTVTGNPIGLDSDVGALLSRSNNTVRGNGSNGSFTGTFAAD